MVVLLLFAPLPQGAVRPWAQVAIECGVSLLLALWFVRMAMAREVHLRLTPLLWPGLAMAGLVAWQVLSPGGSVYPYATWESARLYGAYLGLVLVVGGLPMTRARLLRLTSALVAWAVVLAAVGFARQFGLIGSWLGVPDARLTSTFFNPNHQAVYFSLALFVALGLLLRPSGRGIRADATRIGTMTNLPVRILLAGGVLVLALALVLTLSRGGIVSTMAGLLAMLALALSTRSGRRPILAILVVAFGVGVYASWVGLAAVADRFSTIMRESVSDLRGPIWHATLRVVGDAPVTGVGLGAFQDGFLPHRPVQVPAEKVVNYAHNDFLQLLAETGVVGLFIGAWALVALLVFTVRRWRDRRDPFVRGMVLGGVGAVVAAMVHSVMDFGLHMPANALALALVAGLLPLVVTLHRDATGERVGLGEWRRPLTPRLGGLIAALVVAVATLVLARPGVAVWHSEAAYDALRGAPRERGIPTQGDLTSARGHLRAAVAWDRGNAADWAALAEVSVQQAARVWGQGILPNGERLSDPSPGARLRAAGPILEEAYDAYRTSLRLRPRASEVHERLGRFLSGVEGMRVASRRVVRPATLDTRHETGFPPDQSMIPEALVHFREAIRWDPLNAYHHRSLASFALSHAASEVGPDVASAAISQALALRPDFLPEILDELQARQVDDGSLLAAMPRKSEVLLDLGRLLEDRGKRRAATSAFEEAIGLARTPAQEVEARLEHARALIGRKEPLVALDQARRALVASPREAEVFAVLAAIHAQMNQGAEAETALATAVSLAEAGPSRRRNGLRGELASLFVQRGQWERAVTLLRQVLRESPNDGWAHLQLAGLLEQHGDAAGALQEYRAASAVGGQAWDLHHAVARALRDAGYLREAVNSYEAARQLRPTDAEIGAELGDLYARIGLRDRAIEQYREVLRRQPGHEGARRGLAGIAAGAGS